MAAFTALSPLRLHRNTGEFRTESLRRERGVTGRRNRVPEKHSPDMSDAVGLGTRKAFRRLAPPDLHGVKHCKFLDIFERYGATPLKPD